MARTFQRLEKHVYYVGELLLVESSTPYTPLQTMYFKSARITLDAGPQGAGNTIVSIIRNGNVNDIIYSTSFAAGETSKTLSTEATLNAGDTMSLNVSSVADTSGGSDLVFALEYHH